MFFFYKKILITIILVLNLIGLILVEKNLLVCFALLLLVDGFYNHFILDSYKFLYENENLTIYFVLYIIWLFFSISKLDLTSLLTLIECHRDKPFGPLKKEPDVTKLNFLILVTNQVGNFVFNYLKIRSEQSSSKPDYKSFYESCFHLYKIQLDLNKELLNENKKLSLENEKLLNRNLELEKLCKTAFFISGFEQVGVSVFASLGIMFKVDRFVYKNYKQYYSMPPGRFRVKTLNVYSGLTLSERVLREIMLNYKKFPYRTSAVAFVTLNGIFLGVPSLLGNLNHLKGMIL